MKQPIVISATTRMAEHCCREILNINPRIYAMSVRTAARHGLVGMKNPVVVVYCSNLAHLWDPRLMGDMYQNLKLSEAIVIELPEVIRISRTESVW